MMKKSYAGWVFNLFYIIAVVTAVVDWIALAGPKKRVDYFAKPGVIIALLIWLALNGNLSGHLIWFFIGLLFSLAGDVFLLLPKEQFKAGLVSFLFVQVAYTIGFNDTLPPVNLASFSIFIIIAITACQIFRSISTGLERSNNSKMKVPFLIYSITISLMVLSACLTLVKEDWNAGPALFVSGGAVLFFLSDTLLTWNRFVTPLPNAKLQVRVTYQSGQLLIVLGAFLHFTWM
jgi:uncharacterized membrane protein YhhN